MSAAFYRSLAEILSHSLLIPLRIYQNEDLQYQIPAPLETISEQLHLGCWTGFTQPPAPQQGILQYIKNPYEEVFLCYALENGDTLWFGPFLLTKQTPHDINVMIQRHAMPIHKLPQLKDYYDSLTTIEENRFPYLMKLMELTLNGADTGQPANTLSITPISPPAADLISPSATGRLSTTQIATTENTLFSHAPYFMELKMAHLITSGDLENAMKTMEQINQFNRAVLSNIPIRSHKNSLICVCTIFARAAIAGGVSPDDAFDASDRHIMEIEEIQDISQLQGLEFKMMMTFVNLVHTFNLENYSKPVRMVIGHIRNNLSEVITLEELAEIANLHKNYLSSLFKKETGMTIMSYIIRQRIEDSKIFLRYTEDSIMDIAAFYQFSSHSHFTRNFREITGITPLQYRRRTE